MKNISILVITISSLFLSGCMFAPALVSAGVSAVMKNRSDAKASIKVVPEYILIEQKGRIITASFSIKGTLIGDKKMAQIRGFEQWATAAVVREAPERSCINVLKVYSSDTGEASKSLLDGGVTKKIKFKCLKKEIVASEQNLLEDQQVIYEDHINYIEENPKFIRYSETKSVE